MKKYSILVLFVLAAMIFGVTAVASAESKGDYYDQIDQALCGIEDAIRVGDTVEMQSQLGQLRTAVYSAARYLTLTGEYDSRLMSVISLATRATEMTSDEDITWYITRARILASEILLGRFPADQGCPECDAFEGHS